MANPLHILYIQQLLVLPGMPGNSRCWEFAVRWTQAGHQVSFLCSSAGLPLSIQERAQAHPQGRVQVEGIDLFVLPVHYAHKMVFPRRVIAFLQFYFKAWRKRNSLPSIDLILAYSAPLSVIELGRKLSSWCQKPLFLELGDVWPDVPIGMGIIRNPFLIRWLQRRTQRIYDHAQGLFPYSEGMAEQVASHGVSPAKIHVSHNGVDTDQVPFVTRQADEDAIRVIYTGTIGKANDLSQFLKAIHLIEKRQERPKIQFTIVGAGNDEDQVKRKAEALDLHSLQFLEKVSREEATKLLQKADIGVLCFAAFPVLEANGATKFFDYLASGLPVVINYRGWQATYLQSAHCGLSSVQGDIQGFADNVVSLAQNSALRKAMGENGRRLVEARFSREQLASKMIQQINNFLY